MHTWYLPTSRDALNEATEYYVQTLGRAANELGYAIKPVESVNCIPPRADVLAIDCKMAFRLILSRPFARTWLWIQGIVPEESALHFGDGFRNKLRQAYWAWFERVAIPRARGTFVVSEAMRHHYASKYGFTGNPTFVMPCVNQDLDERAFHAPGKYASPSFVYAGSMHRWQCFDLTLDVFRRVRKARTDARLTVLTRDTEAARRALRDAGVDDVTVTCVPLQVLQETLRSYKYGFVLRQHHVVNAVATPTKVSSYMAAGVIPVITTAVRDYAARLSSLENVIMTASVDPQEIAQRILAFEARSVSPQHVLSEYRRVFDSYFDHRNYLPDVVEFLRRTGLGEASSDRKRAAIPNNVS